MAAQAEVEYVGASTLYAEFDLRGLATGDYEVRIRRRARGSRNTPGVAPRREAWSAGVAATSRAPG